MSEREGDYLDASFRAFSGGQSDPPTLAERARTDREGPGAARPSDDLTAAEWTANASVALDHLDSLYYSDAGITVADYRAATDAVRAALLALAERLEGNTPSTPLANPKS